MSENLSAVKSVHQEILGTASVIYFEGREAKISHEFASQDRHVLSRAARLRMQRTASFPWSAHF